MKHPIKNVLYEIFTLRQNEFKGNCVNFLKVSECFIQENGYSSLEHMVIPKDVPKPIIV